MQYKILKTSILLFLLVVMLSPSLFSGLSEDELEPFEKVLPKGLTVKGISEWPLEVTYRKSTFVLEVNTYTFKLKSKDKKKLEKKGKVRFRIAGEVTQKVEGKKDKRNYKGSVKIYLLSTGDKPAIVAHKKFKLSKLCPS